MAELFYPESPYSTSAQFDRPASFPIALLAWSTARDAALAAEVPADGQFDCWGAAVDRVVAARASTRDELELKIQVMIAERRGGEGCLLAILNDLSAMADGEVADA